MKKRSFTYYLIAFFAVFTFVSAQKSTTLLEWKRYSKLVAQKPYEIEVITSISEDKIGFYKLKLESDGKITYKSVLNQKDSDFSIYKGVSYKAELCASASFQKRFKVTYIKYKILKPKNGKLIFTGKILNKKETKLFDNQKISSWYRICRSTPKSTK